MSNEGLKHKMKSKRTEAERMRERDDTVQPTACPKCHKPYVFIPGIYRPAPTCNCGTDSPKCSSVSDEGLRARAEQKWNKLPHCCGYPKCDGDLVGIYHSEECPMFGDKTEPTRQQFAADFAHQIREEDCKAVCEWCRDINHFEPAKKNDYGYWEHMVRLRYPDKAVLCKAAAIRNLAEKETKA